jgi:hypothetical protein
MINIVCFILVLSEVCFQSPVWFIIIIIIIIIIIMLYYITFMLGIYNCIPETNHVSRVYSVAAVLYLHFVLHVMLFRP